LKSLTRSPRDLTTITKMPIALRYGEFADLKTHGTSADQN